MGVHMRTTIRILSLVAFIALVSTARARGQNESLGDVAARAAQGRGSTTSRTYRDADLKPPPAERREPAESAERPIASAALTTAALAAGGSPETIVRTVMPAVVTIQTDSASGSGFFVAPDTIVTNRHVVGNADRMTIRYANGTTTQASIGRVATDADLALVHVDNAPPLQPTLTMAPVATVQVGEEVLVVGSALGLLQGTVTRGIVSAVRTIGGLRVLQTDAAINPGNSGGPVVNRAGQVVGITTAKMAAAESLGFAIAADHAMDLLGGRTGVTRAEYVTSDADRQLAAVFNGTGPSGSDALRESGVKQYESAVQALARQADNIDTDWRRYRSACAEKAASAPASGGREWFGIWNGAIAARESESSPQCRAFWNDIVNASARVKGRMVEIEEAARRAGVYPGSARSVRAKYVMDWAGWDR